MSTLVESPQPEREKKQQSEQQQVLARSRLLQRLLLPNPDIRQFLNDLVYTQAVVVAGTEAAAFIIEALPGEEQKAQLVNVAHIRPDNSTPEVRAAALKAFTEIIGTCVNEQKDGAIEVGAPELDKEPQYCLVTLLRAENRIVAATAVITRCRDAARAQQRLESMQLVAGYFDYYLLRRGNEQLKVMAANHQDVLQYATAVGTSDGFSNAVNNLANELAARTGATRVSIGWVVGRIDGANKIKLRGLSHTEQFDKKQELSVQITRTMEECLDQEEIVQFDPGPTQMSTANITREAQALSRMEGNTRVISLPLRRKGDPVGVITLEFSPDRPPSESETTGLAVAAELLGPILFDRHANDRWLIVKAGQSIKEGAKWAVGPKHWLAKIIIIVSLAGFWGLAGGWVPFVGYTLRPMNHVKAPFEFVAVERRVVSAPFEGILRQVHKRPGDFVRAGDPVVSFETREIEKQLTEAMKERREAELRYNILIADRDDNGQPRTAEAMVERERADAAQARIDLLNLQLDKAVVKAPIDGQITSNIDLRDRIDDTIKQGDQLFEVTNRDAGLRVQISLSERDIERVAEGKRGEFRTTADPTRPSRFTVERIVPAGKADQGKNVFLVYGQIDADTPPEALADWAPGQKGEVAIEDAPRSLLWQWTHRLVEWVRLKLWI